MKSLCVFVPTASYILLSLGRPTGRRTDPRTAQSAAVHRRRRRELKLIAGSRGDIFVAPWRRVDARNKPFLWPPGDTLDFTAQRSSVEARTRVTCCYPVDKQIGKTILPRIVVCGFRIMHYTSVWFIIWSPALAAKPIRRRCFLYRTEWPHHG